MASTSLDFGMGICWTVVYITAIVEGFRRKTWCIPAVSICINFSWEFWSVVVKTVANETGQSYYIPLVWLLLDIGVFLTLLLYGPKNGSKICWGAVAGLTAATLVGGFVFFQMQEFLLGSYLDNVTMSALFVRRRIKGDQNGDVKVIAVMKLIGTLCATMLYGWLWKDFFF